VRGYRGIAEIGTNKKAAELNKQQMQRKVQQMRRRGR
jgi:hypothetical protein